MGSGSTALPLHGSRLVHVHPPSGEHPYTAQQSGVVAPLSVARWPLLLRRRRLC
jgi:hypothetical protein